MQKIIQDQLDILNNRIKFFGKTRIQDHLQALDKIGEFGTPYDAQYVVQYIHLKCQHYSGQKIKQIIEVYSNSQNPQEINNYYWSGFCFYYKTLQYIQILHFSPLL